MLRRQMLRGLFLAILIASSAPVAAWAEHAEVGAEDAEAGSEAPAEEEDPTFETVVVGDRVPEDPFRSARSVSVVDGSDLSERAPRTVPEALWDAPGVFVQQTNHGGGSPILRGLIGPQNLILVDGVRLNNSTYRTGPLQYLNLVDPLSIGRIEVLRGPGSVLYGSDAMGGVVEVMALRPDEFGVPDQRGVGGRLALRFGSADLERTAHGAVAFGVGGFSGLSVGTYRGMDDLTGGRGVGRQVHSGYEQWSALGRMSYRFQTGVLAGWSLSLGYLMGRIEGAGRTDKLLDSRSLQIYDNDDHLHYARLHLLLPQLRTTGDLTLSWQRFFERKDSITLDEELFHPLRTTRDETRADTLGLDLQLSTRPVAGRLRLRYGVTWYLDLVEASRFTRARGADPFRAASTAAYPDGSRYDTYGAFLLVDGSPLATERGHELRLGAGYRYHGMAGHAPAGSDLPEVDFAFDGHVFFGSAQYLLRDDLALAFTFSQGFRAPNLSEAVLLGDTGKYFHVPNPDLGPERSDTFEVLARGRFLDITLTGAGYVSLLHDLIRREETEWEGQRSVGGKPVAWNLNGGEGLLWGVEARLAVDLGHGLHLLGSLTYTWGEERVEGGEDVPLTRIPPLFGVTAMRWESGESGRLRGFVEGHIRWATHQDRLSAEDERDARIPEDGTPGWWTLGVRAGLTVSDRLALGLSFENLLNEAYRYHGSGIYGPGTSVVVSAELGF